MQNFFNQKTKLNMINTTKDNKKLVDQLKIFKLKKK